MNSKGIDDQARRHKTMNTVSMIESKRRENNIERDTEPERGISALSSFAFKRCSIPTTNSCSISQFFSHQDCK